MKHAVYERVRRHTPEQAKRVLAPLRNALVSKHTAEMRYWRTRHTVEGGRFGNDHYQPLMLAIADEPHPGFVDGKVIADFGCGPRGTLQWAGGATVAIGIDVLASRYAEEFPGDITQHNMVYVTATERVIPVATSSVDLLFTVNALDHVDNLQDMCGELIRILKPEGELIASFNINEHVTASEPQQLSEARLERSLLRFFTSSRYVVGRQGPEDDRYAEMRKAQPAYRDGERAFVWFRGRKR